MARWGKRVEPQETQPSAAMLFPHVRLGLAIVERAAWDLLQGDPLERLDAYLFLERDAPIFLQAAGLDVDISRWLSKTLKKKGRNK